MQTQHPKEVLYDDIYSDDEARLNAEIDRVMGIVRKRLRAIHPRMDVEVALNATTMLTHDFLYGPEELRPPH